VIGSTLQKLSHLGEKLPATSISYLPPHPKRKSQPQPRKTRGSSTVWFVALAPLPQQHKLIVYKKAKLLNAIKWELRGAGHQETLIDEIIALLTPLLT
jgi:hypothetical protein